MDPENPLDVKLVEKPSHEDEAVPTPQEILALARDRVVDQRWLNHVKQLRVKVELEEIVRPLVKDCMIKMLVEQVTSATMREVEPFGTSRLYEFRDAIQRVVKEFDTRYGYYTVSMHDQGDKYTFEIEVHERSWLASFLNIW